MYVTRDPDVYGATAKEGLFIPLKELQDCPNLLKSMERTLSRELAAVGKKYDYFKGIHEAGEATSRQCTLMDLYKEKIEVLSKMSEEIQNCINRFSQKGDIA